MFTVEDYAEAKRLGAPHAGRAGSPKTVEAYAQALRLGERLAGKPLARFAPRDADAVLRRADRYAPATRNQMVVALRQAFEWAARTGRYAGENPFAHVGRAPVADRLPRALPMADVARILAAVRRCGGRQGEKYELAFAVQATSGLRLGEVLALRGGDLREGGVEVRGKGNKRRYVPLRPDVLARLRALADVGAPERPLFRGAGPRSRDDRPMDQSAFSRLFKRAVTEAGLDPAQVTPHALRHSFATHALRTTGRLEVVQDLLGHADPKTTRVYARLLRDDLDAAHASLW